MSLTWTGTDSPSDELDDLSRARLRRELRDRRAARDRRRLQPVSAREWRLLGLLLVLVVVLVLVSGCSATALTAPRMSVRSDSGFVLVAPPQNVGWRSDSATIYDCKNPVFNSYGGIMFCRP